MWMYCPKCKSKTDVEKTIVKEDKVFRYRKCRKCNWRFKTVEVVSDGWDYKGVLKRIKEMIEGVGIK